MAIGAEVIFRDDKDRREFVSTLGEACAKTGWQIHAWCLMPNHFHLVVETPKGNYPRSAQYGRARKKQFQFKQHN